MRCYPVKFEGEHLTCVHQSALLNFNGYPALPLTQAIVRFMLCMYSVVLCVCGIVMLPIAAVSKSCPDEQQFNVRAAVVTDKSAAAARESLEAPTLYRHTRHV